jgi:iron(III) transport system substrate-binding protein
MGLYSRKRNRNREYVAPGLGISKVVTTKQHLFARRHIQPSILKPWGFFSLAFVFLCAALVPSAAAQDFGKSFAEIVARAKKEGKLRFCAGTPDEKEAKAFFKAFGEKYPEISIEYTRCRPAATSERILTELIAGQVDYDLIVVFDPLIPQFKKAGVLAGPFDWTGLFGIRTMYVSPDRYFVGSGSSTDSIVYNSRIVPKERAPRDWEDCLDPYWRGKFVVDSRGGSFVRLYPGWGKEKVADYARRLAANKPVFIRGQTEVLSQISNGEYPMMCGTFLSSALTFTSQDPAAPLAIVIPKEVGVDLYATLAVVKKAQNPNAALLMAGYLASDEGQRAYRVGFRESPLDETTGSGKRFKEAGAKIMFTGWNFTPEQQNEALRTILQAWGLPVGKMK